MISVNDLKTDSENDNDKVNMPSLPSPEPMVSCFDDLEFFNDFENEFPAIVYNDAQTSKLDGLDYFKDFENEFSAITLELGLVYLFETTVMSTMDLDGVTCLNWLFATGRMSGAHISRGQFVARLADHFGLLTAEILGGLTVIAPELPVDLSSASTHQLCRTIPQRLGILEEDVQGLRRDVGSLCGLVERSMTDQGRFSTWLMTCMTQLMDASGLTYQAFDISFRGSSPATFQRRTRQRTGEASTSTAQPDPLQPDP
ncbi:hypothetical protein Tco_1101532 [Tanacetum coccineum]